MKNDNSLYERLLAAECSGDSDYLYSEAKRIKKDKPVLSKMIYERALRIERADHMGVDTVEEERSPEPLLEASNAPAGTFY